MNALHRPGLALVLVLGYLLFVAPFADLPMVRRLKADPSSWRRLRLYRIGIASAWAFALLCGLLWRHPTLHVAHAPGQPGWIFGARWHTKLVGTLLAVFLALALMPGLLCSLQPRRIPGYTRAARTIAFFLPHTPLERRWFALVSVTAGLTEEWIFRGYLLQELQRQTGCSLSLALAVSSLLFGWNHLYQGLGNTVKTTVAGLAFGVLAILTGGLLIPMLLHALVDLQVNVFFRPERMPEEVPPSAGPHAAPHAAAVDPGRA